MRKFFIKNVKHYNFSKIKENNKQQNNNVINNKVDLIINDVDKNKSEEVMDTKEKIELANKVLGNDLNVKKVKKEKGLIERTESSVTILTEDNRELLKD